MSSYHNGMGMRIGDPATEGLARQRIERPLRWSAIVATAGLVGLGGCGDDGGSTGGGGAGATTASSTGGQDAGGNGTGGNGTGGNGTGGNGGGSTSTGSECSAPDTCPAPSSPCQFAVCVDGECGAGTLPNGTTCSVGADDGECVDGACRVCMPGDTTCVADALLTCNADGQFEPPVACEGGTPYCDSALSACVECLDVSDCTTNGSNPCVVPACDAGACETTPAAPGTVCVINGAPGVCEGGQCGECASGAKQCKPGLAAVPQLCVNGTWSDLNACAANQVCNAGQCVAAPCGDGLVQQGEQCDDGNAMSCDGCESCQTRRWLDLPAGAKGEVPALANMLPTGNACYEAWVRTSGAVNDAVYMATTTSPTQSNFILRCLNSNILQFAAQNGSGALIELKPNVACGDGMWHHVAGCRVINGASATMTLYWDGMAVATGSGSTSSIGPATKLVLGGVNYATTGLAGQIDEVRISNVNRYPANFIPARRFVPDANTVALFHLDETAGTSFVDVNGLAGTLSGATNWLIDTGYNAMSCP